MIKRKVAAAFKSWWRNPGAGGVRGCDFAKSDGADRVRLKVAEEAFRAGWDAAVATMDNWPPTWTRPKPTHLPYETLVSHLLDAAAMEYWPPDRRKRAAGI